jgi:hypothetical protein
MRNSRSFCMDKRRFEVILGTTCMDDAVATL